MNWRQDPRIQKLLEKETLESLFKCYFQRVCGIEEIAEMEDAMKVLKRALSKYNKKDLLYEKLRENDEDATEPLVNECLDRLCDVSGQDHSPDNLLVLAKLFDKVGDYRLACELIWCSASLAIQEFIADRQLNVSLNSHSAKRRFASSLSPSIGHHFAVFESCHSSFYTNSHNDVDVKNAYRDVQNFIQMLRELDLTDEMRKELEKNNFNTTQPFTTRIQKLLEKETLESLFKCYFQRAYGIKEIAEMENAMKHFLAKYDKKDLLYEKLREDDKNATEPLDNERLDRLCEVSGQDHSPDNLLVLAKLFDKVGDYRFACELIWCSASLAIQEFIADRQLKVLLNSYNGKRRFTSALSRDIARRFCVFEVCHSSFYTNSHDALDVKNAYEDAKEFIQKLRELQITDESKKELEKKNFNI